MTQHGARDGGTEQEMYVVRRTWPCKILMSRLRQISQIKSRTSLPRQHRLAILVMKTK